MQGSESQDHFTQEHCDEDAEKYQAKVKRYAGGFFHGNSRKKFNAKNMQMT
jgi:hypothetical protein